MIADRILDQLRAEIPELCPNHDHEYRRYLLDWTPVISDSSGSLRNRALAFRERLRNEMFAGESPPPRRAGARAPTVEHFVFLYDKNVPEDLDDRRAGALIDRLTEDFGRCDSVCLWQSYPRLGLDERNQFDYYRDFFGDAEGDGGIRYERSGVGSGAVSATGPAAGSRLTSAVQAFHARGVRVSLNYNPWDTGTRREAESDAATLGRFLAGSGADGLFLDTMSSVDRQFLAELRAHAPAAIVCPELLPPLADTVRLTESWQQFALPGPREIPVHRWLDPALSLRVVDRNGIDRREETFQAFMYGSGYVVWENVFGWWNPWSAADRMRLKTTSAMLSRFQTFFADAAWEPFVDLGDSTISAHLWHSGDDALLTVRNIGARSSDTVASGRLRGAWRSATNVLDGEHVRWDTAGDGGTLPVHLEAGEVTAIFLSAMGIDEAPAVCVARPTGAGADARHERATLAAYDARPAITPATRGNRRKRAGLRARTWLHAATVPIDAARYTQHVRRNVHDAMEGGTYGDISSATAKRVPPQHVWLPPYRISRTPVTNAGYARFLRESRYLPTDLRNFLAHWRRPPGSEAAPGKWRFDPAEANHPVRWVSLDDARAFAAWADMRLPTEAEWQYAAEGPEGVPWPWGTDFDAARCNGTGGRTTPVDRFPAGASWCGCLDLCGNVWEWTESERDDGHTRYAMVRGGCSRVITGSIWYTASGPQPCNVHEKVLLRNPAVDRLSTVGFRCCVS